MSLYKSEDTLEQVTKSLQSWKKLIVDIYDDEYDNDENKENEKNGQLNVLQKYVEEYGQIEIDCEKTKAALQKLDEKLEEKEKPCEDVDGLYRECYDSLPEPSVNHYHDTRVWQAVFEGATDVQEIHKKKKKLHESQYEELSDSLMCSNIFSPPLDPISKVVVKNAYKSRKCGHVYEFETISDYIRQMKAKAKCPYIGCSSNQLKMSDLVQDSKLQSQITQYLETHNDDSEDDD